VTDTSALTPRGIAVLIGLAGAAYMAAVAANLLFASPHPPIGAQLYDLYAEALLHGRFDLPALALRYEGHFAPDGTGYLYYGLGPLLTRLPFLAFVDLPTNWISAFSIWFWAVCGTACYHRAFWLGLAEGLGGADRIGGKASAVLAFAIWFASPGALLASAGAVFHEPIAMAYALGGGLLLLLAMACFGRIGLERAIVPMTLLAGLTVHARPHLAFGYYLSVCLLVLLLFVTKGMRHWKTMAISMALLGLFGAGLLAFNAARFGDAVTMHGSFSEGELQYSSMFWGLESENSPRAQAFEQHGRFSAARILPNTLVYFFSPPSGLGMDAAISGLERAYDAAIPETDLVIVNEPKAGALFLWPAWMALMVLGFASRALRRLTALAGLAGVAAGTLLVLSYPTVTMRYHVDIWPFIAFPAIFGLVWLGKRPSGGRLSSLLPAVLGVLVLLGTAVTLHKTMHNKLMNLDSGSEWTPGLCLDLTAKKGFSPQRGREICGI
jgi:hypothetical protein